MKILVDMNLSPLWCDALRESGWESVHWSQVGSPRATDREIMGWAHANGFVVFTNDLDFGSILAATRAAGPSVIQVRTQDVSIAHLKDIVVALFLRFEHALEAGALITVDEARSRIRILPLSS